MYDMKQSTVHIAKKSEFPKGNIVFSASWNPEMKFDRLNINNDLLPAKFSGVRTLNTNIRVSGKVTIAYEIVGHYEAYANGKAFNFYDVDPAALEYQHQTGQKLQELYLEFHRC